LLGCWVTLLGWLVVGLLGRRSSEVTKPSGASSPKQASRMTIGPPVAARL
jgi:hypothetical protein